MNEPNIFRATILEALSMVVTVMSASKPDPKKEFGRRLRALRFALGTDDPKTGLLKAISQDEMADFLGVRPGAYQKNESLGTMPPLPALQKLINEGVCGPGYLLVGKRDNPREIQEKIDRAKREQRKLEIRRRVKSPDN